MCLLHRPSCRKLCRNQLNERDIQLGHWYQFFHLILWKLHRTYSFSSTILQSWVLKSDCMNKAGCIILQRPSWLMNWSQQQTIISSRSPFFVQLKTMAKIRRHLLRKQWKKNPVRHLLPLLLFFLKINSSAKNTYTQNISVNAFFFLLTFFFQLCAPHLFFTARHALGALN